MLGTVKEAREKAEKLKVRELTADSAILKENDSDNKALHGKPLGTTKSWRAELRRPMVEGRRSRDGQHRCWLGPLPLRAEPLEASSS